MIKYFFLFLFGLHAVSLFSQEYNITIIVVDSLTKEPLPYSSLEINGKGGAIANQWGVLDLKFYEEDLSDICLTNNLAYFPKKYLLRDLLAKDTILLALKPYEFETVEIRENTLIGSQEMGIQAGTANAAYGMSQWMQVALEMDGSRYPNRRIKEVLFYIFPSKKYDTPFRIRIYGADENGKPDKDLLIQNLIMQAKQIGWQSFSLEKPIDLPEAKFFIAMEWINSGEKYAYKKRILGKNRKYYGQQLGNVLKQKAPKTWIKVLGRGWKLDNHTIANGNLGYRNAMIKISTI